MTVTRRHSAFKNPMLLSRRSRARRECQGKNVSCTNRRRKIRPIGRCLHYARSKKRPMEHTVTVLHISDLHARGPRETESWRRRRVTGDETWRRNLEDLQKDGPIDLVCFTGDVADWGRSDEYPSAGEFLAQTP